MVVFSSNQDFSRIVDRQESVNWYRPQSDAAVLITGAWRLSDTRRTRDGSTFTRQTVRWVLPHSVLGGEAPFPGDLLREPGGTTWKLTEVQNLTKIACWKCTGENLTLSHRLCETLDLYRPRWTLDEQGVPVPEYRLERPGIPASLRFCEPPQVEIAFIGLGLTLSPRDCFLTSDNRIFRVLQFTQAPAWNELAHVLAEEAHEH